MLLGNLRRYTAGTSRRFATRRSEEGLKRSLRIAKALPRYTSYAPQSYEAKPLPASSPLRGVDWSEGPVLATAFQLRSMEGHERSDVAPGDVPRIGTSQSALQPLAPAVRGGRQGPAGGMGRDAHSFSPGQEALSKSPAAPHGLVGLRPTSVKRGCPSLWLLSLGQARESNPASGRRSEARGRRASSPYR